MLEWAKRKEFSILFTTNDETDRRLICQWQKNCSCNVIKELIFSTIVVDGKVLKINSWFHDTICDRAFFWDYCGLDIHKLEKALADFADSFKVI